MHKSIANSTNWKSSYEREEQLTSISQQHERSVSRVVVHSLQVGVRMPIRIPAWMMKRTLIFYIKKYFYKNFYLREEVKQWHRKHYENYIRKEFGEKNSAILVSRQILTVDYFRSSKQEKSTFIRISLSDWKNIF